MHYSNHAQQRLRQRGIQPYLVDLVFKTYDQVDTVKGADRLSISKKKLNELIEDNKTQESIRTLLKRHYSKVCKLVLVVSFDACIITVMYR
jgi:SOS response regulatory protein OraA/RecX